jgi:hypothetical protein
MSACGGSILLKIIKKSTERSDFHNYSIFIIHYSFLGSHYHPVKFPSCGRQLTISSLLSNSAVFQNHYAARLFDVRQPVGQDKHGSSPGKRFQGADDQGFIFGVQTGGGLIQQQYRCTF